MAGGTYNRFRYNLMKKLVDLSGDTIKVMLMNNSHSFNTDHNVPSDVTANEIANGSGYTTGGATLASKTVTQNDTSNLAVFDAADVSWSSFTASIYHAVLWDDTVATDDLICSIDFGGVQTVTGGTFTIQWDSVGILTLA